MGIQVTLAQLKAIYKEQAHETVLAAALPGLNRVLEKYKINENKNEVASFLAQVGHESGQLGTRMENLNYSADGLLKIFRKYFPTQALANSYARQPIKIANRVYASRMGNGPETSGDGWKHRGRGYIQITGAEKYQQLAKYLGKTVDDTIKFLETDDGAWESAGWFWMVSGLDRYDDDASALAETKIVNGGVNGLADRQQLLDRGLKVL